MSKPSIRETDLYLPIKAYLERPSYDGQGRDARAGRNLVGCAAGEPPV